MKFNYEATGIGSVPFKDPIHACRIILDIFKDIPFWPQLPKRSFLENMYTQYAEGFPGIVVDEEKKRIYVDEDRAADDIVAFYERYLAKDIDSFAISRERAEGLYAFLELAKESASGARFIKGHVTGPVSFALTITDKKKRSIIYDTELFECVVKQLAMKTIWQIQKLREISENIIIFIDEPQLVSIGSGYINIDAKSAKEKIEELIDVIKAEGVLCGIHCCGNTDWPFLLSRSIDIINFDAYNFIKQFTIFHRDIKNYLKRGGAIAWGIVPTPNAAVDERGKLVRKIADAVDELASKGIDRETLSSIVTPSCGVGTSEESMAETILRMTGEISADLKK
ncbi:MAG: hypothetical protein ABIJ27_05445 [Candidatus Omnitrophota bacterium]